MKYRIMLNKLDTYTIQVKQNWFTGWSRIIDVDHFEDARKRVAEEIEDDLKCEMIALRRVLRRTMVKQVWP